VTPRPPRTISGKKPGGSAMCTPLFRFALLSGRDSIPSAVAARVLVPVKNSLPDSCEGVPVCLGEASGHPSHTSAFGQVAPHVLQGPTRA
jgi:hypothetical protein